MRTYIVNFMNISPLGKSRRLLPTTISARDKSIIKDNIYYLNIKELKSICFKYDIPTNIYYYQDDLLKKSGHSLHKKLLVNNLLRYLDDKPTKKFIVHQNMVCFDKLKKPKAKD